MFKEKRPMSIWPWHGSRPIAPSIRLRSIILYYPIPGGGLVPVGVAGGVGVDADQGFGEIDLVGDGDAAIKAAALSDPAGEALGEGALGLDIEAGVGLNTARSGGPASCKVSLIHDFHLISGVMRVWVAELRAPGAPTHGPKLHAITWISPPSTNFFRPSRARAEESVTPKIVVHANNDYPDDKCRWYSLDPSLASLRNPQHGESEQHTRRVSVPPTTSQKTNMGRQCAKVGKGHDRCPTCQQPTCNGIRRFPDSDNDRQDSDQSDDDFRRYGSTAGDRFG